jgi:kinetochore protein Fta7
MRLTRKLSIPRSKYHAMARASKPTRPSRKQYASLQPRVKTLKEATIRKRWKKLAPASQARVADLLRTVERPTLTHGGNDRRNIEVQAAISELVEGYVGLHISFRSANCLTHTIRLIERLPRMPFPPGTDELSFDFESTINRQVS